VLINFEAVEGCWVAQWVKRPTLDLGSGLDVSRVVSLSLHWALSWAWSLLKKIEEEKL